MATAISTSTTACLSTFNKFIEDIREIHGSNELRKGLVVSAWEDELGRLRIWAANTGAHQTGCSSLDFRLRDASHIRDQIMKLLESLRRKLQDTRVALAEEENDDVEVIDELVDLEDAKTETQELQEGLVTIIDCLFQMSMLVRNPAPHDLRLGSKDPEVAAFEPHDYNHVRKRYPRADDALVKRLSNAITLRRKYLKYRERHAMKLRQGIENVGQVVHSLQDVKEGGTVREGTEITNNAATDFDPDVASDDNASDLGVSQTSYTPTPIDRGNITIPPAPKSSLRGVPFECPYCFHVITVSGSRSWIKHVFQDLPPYICVAPTCLTPNKLYSTVHEWLHHSAIAHPEVTSDHNAPQSDWVLCPLCIEDLEQGKNYDRHLARHLQELALFILPRSDEDSGTHESNSDSGKGGSRVSEDESSELDDRPSEKTVVQRLIPKTLGGESLGDIPTADLSVHDEIIERERERRKREESRLLHQLAQRKELLGAEHPDTLSSVESLVLAYETVEKLWKAEPLQRQVATIRTSTLGAEHPDRLSSIINRAKLFAQQGCRVEARGLLQATLGKAEEILGRDHLSTLKIIWALGDVLKLQGKPEEAESFYIRALTGYDKVYGPEHPLTLDTLELLALFCSIRGKLAEAQGFYERALTGNDKAYGSGHENTLIAAGLLADNFARRGKLEEAELLCQRLLNGYEKLYGSEHLSTLDIVTRLGDISTEQNKLAEAQRFYERALNGYEKFFGPDNPSTRQLVQGLHKILTTHGKLAEANALLTGTLNNRSY